MGGFLGYWGLFSEFLARFVVCGQVFTAFGFEV